MMIVKCPSCGWEGNDPPLQACKNCGTRIPASEYEKAFKRQNRKPGQSKFRFGTVREIVLETLSIHFNTWYTISALASKAKADEIYVNQVCLNLLACGLIQRRRHNHRFVYRYLFPKDIENVEIPEVTQIST